MPAAPLSPLQQLRVAITRGDLTPRAAIEQVLARANSNASRNVYIGLRADAALREADELPGKFSADPKPLLYGVSISLKDCFDLAGFTTSCGSRSMPHKTVWRSKIPQ